VSRKRRQLTHANHERWLVSYADFITLLFAFFVVLYASSQVDKAKMGKLAAAIEGAFQQLGAFQGSGVEPPVKIVEEIGANSAGKPGSIDPGEKLRFKGMSEDGGGQFAGEGLTRESVDQLKKDLEQALAAEINRRDVALRVGPDGLVVSLREIGFFDSGSALLKTGSEPTIQHIAELLRDRGVGLRIEGHTDNVPIHTAQFISNWELSTARATEMIKLLISNYRFPADRLSAAGYGEFHPIASNAEAEGRRQNRRVDLVIFAVSATKRASSTSPVDPRPKFDRRIMR
jgi:chemotaxis protein MotB